MMITEAVTAQIRSDALPCRRNVAKALYFYGSFPNGERSFMDSCPTWVQHHNQDSHPRDVLQSAFLLLSLGMVVSKARREEGECVGDKPDTWNLSQCQWFCDMTERRTHDTAGSHSEHVKEFSGSRAKEPTSVRQSALESLHWLLGGLQYFNRVTMSHQSL